jgi:3-oxoacyl-[acyl-carrier protein] reductase
VRVAAVENAQRGVRANVVVPGFLEETLPPELDDELARADTPTRRLTTAADVAAVVAFLLSPAAAQVNGEVIRVDGGYTITKGTRPSAYR